VPRNLRPYLKYKDSGVEWLGEVPEHWEVKRLKALASFNDLISTIAQPNSYGQLQAALLAHGPAYASTSGRPRTRHLRNLAPPG